MLIVSILQSINNDNNDKKLRVNVYRVNKIIVFFILNQPFGITNSVFFRYVHEKLETLGVKMTSIKTIYLRRES